MIITRADKADFEVRKQMAEVFADGFTQWLEYFSKDKKVISNAFAHMFCLDKFYIAINDREVLGIAACTDCHSPSLRLEKKELKKYLGFFKGTIAAMVLKKEFETPFENPPPNTGSIEFVGTSSSHLCNGVATKIINYIIETTPYNEYIIEEVADTNIPAMNLYKKLGFEEYKRKVLSSKKARAINITSFVSLKLKKK